MSTLSLRLPESLHRKIRELAERDDVSINQFISMAVAEKTAALLTIRHSAGSQGVAADAAGERGQSPA
jgi:predicted transcriptional regulator